MPQVTQPHCGSLSSVGIRSAGHFSIRGQTAVGVRPVMRSASEAVPPIYRLIQLSQDNCPTPVPYPAGGYRSSCSSTKRLNPTPSCLICEVHCILQALALALARAGSNRAARMAMMAMTTRSSINVKAAPPEAAVAHSDSSIGILEEYYIGCAVR